MKIKFRKIEIQNFYSYGDKQEVDLDQFKSTVVLIDGIDKDTEGSKIGSGKSSFLAAITYALFGETVSNVKANEIVNYIKGKNALVVLTFEMNNTLFKIERGRKPNILNIYQEIDKDEKGTIQWENISRADIKDNDKLIVSLIKINFETFLQTSLFSVASEHNKPFLNMTPSNQKKVLENIFNFDLFNNMINEIKDDVRDKQIIRAELESSLREVQISNEQIESQIERLKESSEKFEKRRNKRIKELEESIVFYNNIDIEEEKDKFAFIDELKEHKTNIMSTISELKIELKDIQTELARVDREIELLVNDYQSEEENNKSLKGNICPTCHQDWEDPDAIIASDDKLKKIGSEIISFEKSLNEFEEVEQKILKKIKDKKSILFEIKEAIDEIETQIDKKELDNIDIILSNIKKELKNEMNQENHYLMEIEANKSLLREIDTETLDKVDIWIQNIKAFIKLSEDPKTRGKFLRKFIKQSNEILRGFKKLIPDYNIHIQFNPDFTIRVMKLGKEVNPASLSNGEKRIGNIMIMIALMKVFKLKNNVEFNAIFMDEVLDSGINGALLESVYTFIKNVAKEEQMRVYLISHREEIKEKVKEIIMVTKSRGISTIEINPI